MSEASKKAKVRRALKKFEEADLALNQFEHDHNDLVLEMKKLASARSIAMSELEFAIRDTGVEAGGMKLTEVPRRKFDGEKVYRHFTNDPSLRDRLVRIKYAVDPHIFDSMVKNEEISEGLAKSFISDTKTVIRITGKPKDYTLG